MIKLCRRFLSHIIRERKPFKQLESKDVDFFKQLLNNRATTDESELKHHTIDYMGSTTGQGSMLLKPRTTDEVSRILAHCNAERLAVVPQGGNTGLVGGSVPIFDEIILSTGLMDKIIEFDCKSGILTCQAGCVLETLNSFVNEKNFMMPIDLGAKGSCQIGGNVATNAGGLRVVKYGPLRNAILGLEVVLANGDVLDLTSGMRKDNTGIDLKHLFVGAEGSLGVITKVNLLCPMKPPFVEVCFLGLKHFADVVNLFHGAKSSLGDALSVFEFMDHSAMETVQEHMGLRNPLGNEHNFYTLLEVSGTHEVRSSIQQFVINQMQELLIQDGTIAETQTQQDELFAVREKINEATARDGFVYKYDISLPVREMYDIVTHMRERLSPLAKRVIGYGHVGDSNLHLNIVSTRYNQKLHDMIEPFVFEWTAERRGSISAEHGIGKNKLPFLGLCKDPATIAKMKQLKILFDPNLILNPYKVVPL